MQFHYKNYEGLSQYRPPLNYELTGKMLNVLLDGIGFCSFFMQNRKEMVINFNELKTSAPYECLKPDNNIYFVQAEIPSVTPRLCLNFVYDEESGSFTLCRAIQNVEKIISTNLFWRCTEIGRFLCKSARRLYEGSRRNCPRFYLYQ